MRKTKERNPLTTILIVLLIVIIGIYFFLHWVSVSRLSVAESVINSTIRQADYVDYDLSLGLDPEFLLTIYDQDLETLDKMEELIISAEKLDTLEKILNPYSTDYLHLKLTNARLGVKNARFIVLKFLVEQEKG